MTDGRAEGLDPAEEENFRKLFRELLPSEAESFVRPDADVIDRFVHSTATDEEVKIVRQAMVKSQSFRLETIRRLDLQETAALSTAPSTFLEKLRRFVAGPIPGYALSAALAAFLVQDLTTEPRSPLTDTAEHRVEPIFLLPEGTNTRGAPVDVSGGRGVRDLVLREPIDASQGWDYTLEVLHVVEDGERAVRSSPSHTHFFLQGSQLFPTLRLGLSELPAGKYRLRLVAYNSSRSESVTIRSSVFRIRQTLSESSP